MALATCLEPADGKDAPKLFAEAYSARQKFDGDMNDGLAKLRLADKAFQVMTAERLAARDPTGEVEGWFCWIGGML
jgi:putative ATP-dependent endonuclease of the OLD family